MLRALDLAERGKYLASPNPRVGAVIVAEQSGTPSIVGEGFHPCAGRPHAELFALRDAGPAARGATLYVNLEPCCHHGKTPPCVDAILQAGIRRVVVGTQDPFPEVSGKGISILRDQGVIVDVGVCELQCRERNRYFFSVHRRGRPWVILKMAMSLDGKIATRTGDSRWISCEASRKIVQDLRAEVDAVLVGSGTVLKDRPRLTARPTDLSSDEFRQPRRIVLDRRGRLLSNLDCIQDLDAAPLEIIVGRDLVLDKKIDKNTSVRITRWPVENTDSALNDLLRYFATQDIQSLLIEGGQEIATSFLAAGLVDEVFLFIAPMLIGGRDAPSIFGGIGADSIEDARQLKEMTVERVEKDILVRGRLSDLP
ncbi:MAG TPA: bifunctional diaminohydroxyphosphoribosylaminopyrimidine deaminase/5-amino-6-(5-phosphoribosylamino)uracil reductase RibD [bacterium]|nr:bifunctional diaminohydroxyphosphoribosylaminopyrimidine deaminase/5-amino-6-(5-phosphoribosylamino)uracil reductase RibD [bacterium]HQL63769.1 bifunctional diaminohydroxyphosphoribosylaminopyrimidine deaminase/5-amino-6-(5-phosphoribosylamino)uracil reductase RibD [bacterium]